MHLHALALFAMLRTMPPTFRCPLPRYTFTGPAAGSVARLPGVRLERPDRGRPGMGLRISVPRNLAPLAASGLLGALTFTGTWGAPPPDVSWTWERVAAVLGERAEIRELYLSDYPLPYQREGVAFCAGLYGAHMSWPGGAGKTFASICWACLGTGPVLHVTRASVRSQIARQWTRYTTLRPWVLRPVAELRRRDIPWAEDIAETLARGERPVLVLGWESLVNHGQEIAEVFGASLRTASVIFDESHKAKAVKRWVREIDKETGAATFSRRRNVSSAAAELSQQTARRLCTTATFIPDRPRDGWAQLDLAEPGDWGRFLELSEHGAVVGGFAWRYCDAKPGTWGGTDTSGMSNADELLARISTCTHRVSLATTHRDLPPKRRQSVMIPLSEQDPAPAAFRGLYKTAKGAAVLELALMESAAKKRSTILGMVEDACAASQKVVIFTGRVEEVAALETAIRKRLGDVPLWAAVGGQSAHLDACKQAYMDAPGPAILIGTGQAWGTGHDLQDTDLALFAMLPWTGGDLHQWEQRFFRHGMRRPVLICFLICEGSRDEAVVATLLSKLPAVEKLGGDADTAAAADALRGVEDKEAVALSLLGFVRAADVSALDDSDNLEV